MCQVRFSRMVTFGETAEIGSGQMEFDRHIDRIVRAIDAMTERYMTLRCDRR